MTEIDIPSLEGGRDYQIQVQAHAACPEGEDEAPRTEPWQTPYCPDATACTLPGAKSSIALFTTARLPGSIEIVPVE